MSGNDEYNEAVTAMNSLAVQFSKMATSSKFLTANVKAAEDNKNAAAKEATAPRAKSPIGAPLKAAEKKEDSKAAKEKEEIAEKAPKMKTAETKKDAAHAASPFNMEDRKIIERAMAIIKATHAAEDLAALKPLGKPTDKKEEIGAKAQKDKPTGQKELATQKVEVGKIAAQKSAKTIGNKADKNGKFQHPSLEKSDALKQFKSGDNSVHSTGVVNFKSNITVLPFTQSAFQVCERNVGQETDHVVWNMITGELDFVDNTTIPTGTTYDHALEVTSNWRRFSAAQVTAFNIRFSDTVKVAELDAADVEGQVDPKNALYPMENKIRAALNRVGIIHQQSIGVIAAHLLTQMSIYDAVGLFVGGALMCIQLSDTNYLGMEPVLNPLPAGNAVWANIATEVGVNLWMQHISRGTLVLIANDFAPGLQFLIDVILAGLPRFTANDPQEGLDRLQHIASYMNLEPIPHLWIISGEPPAPLDPANQPRMTAANIIIAMRSLADQIGQKTAVVSAFTRITTIINCHIFTIATTPLFVPPEQELQDRYAHQPIRPAVHPILHDGSIGHPLAWNQLMGHFREHNEHVTQMENAAPGDADPCNANCQFARFYLLRTQQMARECAANDLMRTFEAMQTEADLAQDREFTRYLAQLRADHARNTVRNHYYLETASFERGSTVVPRYSDSNSIWRVLKYGGSYRYEQTSLLTDMHVLESLTPEDISRYVGVLGGLISLGFSAVFQEQSIRADTLDSLLNRVDNDNKFKYHFRAFRLDPNRVICPLYIMALNSVTEFTQVVFCKTAFRVPDWCDSFRNFDNRLMRYGWSRPYSRIPYQMDPIAFGWAIIVLLDCWGFVRRDATWDLTNEVVAMGPLAGLYTDTGDSLIIAAAGSKRPYMFVSYPAIVFTAICQHFRFTPDIPHYVPFPRPTSGKAFRGPTTQDDVRTNMQVYPNTNLLKPGQFITFNWNTDSVVAPCLPLESIDINVWQRFVNEVGPAYKPRIGITQRMTYVLPTFTGGSGALAEWFGAKDKPSEEPEN